MSDYGRGGKASRHTHFFWASCSHHPFPGLVSGRLRCAGYALRCLIVGGGFDSKRPAMMLYCLYCRLFQTAAARTRCAVLNCPDAEDSLTPVVPTSISFGGRGANRRMPISLPVRYNPQQYHNGPPCGYHASPLPRPHLRLANIRCWDSRPCNVQVGARQRSRRRWGSAPHHRTRCWTTKQL